MATNVLDKKTLNNYIVSMRNDVTRSKVHTVNHLARRIKELRKKNGTEEQKEKNKKKADRFAQEIMEIKALKRDEVSKFGLTTKEDLNRLQANIAAPMYDRALARLCIHKFVANEIKEFKEKYPISVDQVLKILRTKKGKSKKLASNNNNTIKKEKIKHEEVIESDVQDSENDNISNDDMSDGDVSDGDLEPEMESVEGDDDQSSMDLSSVNDNSSEEETAQEHNVPEVKRKRTQNAKKDKTNFKSNTKIKRKQDDSESNFSEEEGTEIKKFNSKIKNISTAKKVKGVNPFFTSSKNKEYVSSMDVSGVSDNSSEEETAQGEHNVPEVKTKRMQSAKKDKMNFKSNKKHKRKQDDSESNFSEEEDTEIKKSNSKIINKTIKNISITKKVKGVPFFTSSKNKEYAGSTDESNVNDKSSEEEIAQEEYNVPKAKTKRTHNAKKDKMSLKRNKKINQKLDNSESNFSDEEGSEIKKSNSKMINKKLKSISLAKKEEIKGVDPFFITSENKEYVTTQVPTMFSEDPKHLSTFKPKKNKFISSFSAKPFSDNFREKWNTNDRFGGEKQTFGDNANRFMDGFKNRRERRLNLQKDSKNSMKADNIKFKFSDRHEKIPHNNNKIIVSEKLKVEQLHPSWEAKKKLSTMAPFQGKKITFDD